MNNENHTQSVIEIAWQFKRIVYFVLYRKYITDQSEIPLSLNSFYKVAVAVQRQRVIYTDYSGFDSPALGLPHFHVSWLPDFIFYQKPLYKSLHQSFFYSFITILPSERGVTLHYSTILPQILLFRHLTSIFQTFVTCLRENYDYHNVSWEMICI